MTCLKFSRDRKGRIMDGAGSNGVDELKYSEPEKLVSPVEETENVTQYSADTVVAQPKTPAMPSSSNCIPMDISSANNYTTNNEHSSPFVQNAIQCSSQSNTPNKQYDSQLRSSALHLSGPIEGNTLQYSKIESCNIFVGGSFKQPTFPVSSPESASGNSLGGNPSFPPTQPNQISKFSTQFGTVIGKIESTIPQEILPAVFLHIACELTSSDPRDNIFPEAYEADDIKSFFKLGKKYKWWHWMDFTRLISLLQESGCQKSLDVLQRYRNDLHIHVRKRLQQFEGSPPKDEGHWLQLKCECDSMNVTLEAIMQHKSFLMNFLHIPPEAFTFCGHYQGCTVTVWRVHSDVQAEAISDFLKLRKDVIVGDQLKGITMLTVSVDVAKLCATYSDQLPDEESCVVGGKTITLPPDVVVGDHPDMPMDLEELGLNSSHKRIDEDIEHYSELTKRGELDVDHLPSQILSAIDSDGNSLLMIAVQENQPDTVEGLLKASIPQEVRDMPSREEKRSVVCIAAQLNHCQCLGILLRYDCHPALPDITAKLPLHYACANQCLRCVRMITGQARGLTGLFWAKRFLEGSGVDLSDPDSEDDVIEEAITRRQSEVVLPTLFKAAKSGDVDHISEVLEEGDNVNNNQHGDNPLFCAARNGNLEVIKTLEKYGARLQCVDGDGNTLLHAAAHSGRSEVVRFCMNRLATRKGWNINAKNKHRQTPLEIATSKGHLNTVQLLVTNGASLCVPDSSRHLLLSSQYKVIQHFIEKERKKHLERVLNAVQNKSGMKEFKFTWQDPFDHNLRTRDGDSVLMVAVKSGRKNIVEYLCDSLRKCSKVSLCSSKKQKHLQRLEVDYPSEYTRAVSIDSGIGSPQSSPVVQPICEMVVSSPVPGFGRLDVRNDDDSIVPVCTNYITGFTVIHVAVENKMPQILDVILTTFPQLIDVPDNSGCTPLHLAAHRGNKGMMKTLMNNGANASIKNSLGYFPDDLLPNSAQSMRKKLLSIRVVVANNRSKLTESPSVSTSTWSSSSDDQPRTRSCYSDDRFLPERCYQNAVMKKQCNDDIVAL